MQQPADELIQRLRKSAAHVETRAADVEVPMCRHLTLGFVVRSTARHAGTDHIAAFAGNLTYNAFLAAFPFLLFLVSLLKVVHEESLVKIMIDTIARTLPSTASQVLHRQILPEVLSRLTDSPILSVFLALGSLWAVSAVARAGMEAMDVMYGITDQRSVWMRFLLSMILSLAAAVLLLAAVALLVFGPVIAGLADSILGNASIAWWIWSVLQWPLLLSFALLAFALIYYYAPDASQRFRFVSPGALVATMVWLVFSVGFSLVLNHFGQFLVNPIYGWFTGLIIFLMYIYWSSMILLVGAEINRTVRSPETDDTAADMPRSS